MSPVVSNLPQRGNRMFSRIRTRQLLKLLAIGLVVAFIPVALYVSVRSESFRAFRTESPLGRLKDPAVRVDVQAAGRGNPYLNLKNGNQMALSYKGNAAAATALQNGTARSRILAAADLDGDAAPDLVIGYANGGTGIITVQKGNPEGFAPKDDSVFERMHNGYNPPSLLPNVETYQVSSPVDFLQLGDFNGDGRKDVLVGSRDGSLRLLAGDGQGGLAAEQAISLPGTVTALTSGEFRAADGHLDIAVGINGPEGPEVLIYDGANGGFNSEPFKFPVASEAVSVEFGELDSDPFMDLAVASGSEVNIVHGWGRKVGVNKALQVERIPLAYKAQSLAVDNFTWDRQGTREIAVLAEDGSARVLESSKSDKRPLTDADIAARAANRGKTPNKNVDVETVSGWSGASAKWSEVNDVQLNASVTTNAAIGTTALATQALLTHGKISSGETNALLVSNVAQKKLDVLHQVNAKEAAVTSQPVGSVSTISMDVSGTPVASIALPKKLNGVRDMVVLTDESSNAVLVPIEPNAVFGVNTTSDHAPDGACNASPDCTFREAVIAANASAGPDTINLPAGTYTLTIIGNTNNAGAGEGFTGNAAIGDVDFRDTNGDATTVSGAGAGTTFIVQSTANDRVLEPNPTALLNFDWTISGVTIAGGRDTGGSLTGGGGSMLSGSKDNITTITNCVIANNRALGSGGSGGGGVSNQGGSVIVTNTVFGGATTVAACPAQTATNCGNSSSGSGGGIAYSPGDPSGRTPSTGTLTIQTTSSFQNNAANSLTGGGAGAELYTHNLGTGSVSISGTTFTTNTANGTASGGGIFVESIDTTVATSTFTNNSAGNRGGGIQVGGGSLTLNGTNPSITFSGNTAGTPNTSSISTSSAVTLQGTNTTIGGDLEVTTNGSWTNQTGSAMSPNNFIFVGDAFFVGNNSTTNVSGNFQFQSTGSFNAGTGTFNFNGTGAQTIDNNVALTFNNLTDSNTTNPLTINNNIAVNGTLNINGATATLAPLAGTVVSGTGTLTGSGTARVTRITAPADFLTQYSITNKTLTNLTVDYNGAGSQTVNNTPAYSDLVISGSGTKTLQGNTTITSDLNIAAATFASGNFNFALGGNWTNGATFTPGTGTVTFQGTSGTQTLTGTTTFFNLTLNNSGATTNFGATTTTVGNDLLATAGTMDGGTSTIIFTGVTDNLGSISGAAAKNFHNLQINSPATISNASGGAINILNDYANGGTFSQAAGQSTVFASGPDGVHAMSGAGTSTFGLFTVNTGNSVNAAHNFNMAGATFTVSGTGVFGNSGTVSFNGGVAQAIAGDGTKSFGGLNISNVNGVTLVNGTGAVDASVSGILTLTTNLTVAAGAILQQSGTSAGAADVLGTVRRTDLGVVERAFGHPGNTITINSGTPPTQIDLNLVKAAPGTFPAGVRVVPRDVTITPTGGAGIGATLKLRYIDPTELTGPGITESRLVLWKNVGGTTWTAQGGTPDTTNNFVSLSGVSSFSEWAIAEAADLTLSKANNVSGSAVVGQAWNWTLTAANTGSPATFTAGQVILSDDLPTSNLTYGTPAVQNVSNITGSANISCSIASNTLTCTANGGSVTFASNIGASNFDVVFSATPQAAGSYQNPRTGGGVAKIDPNLLIAESNENNNTPTNNTVTVGKANTTTTINSDLPDPSVVGQPVTVTWSVTVNSPGTLGTPLTGNVTVSDGTNQCVAAVSAGQCDVTFTSAGAKNITATYAGDTNYNGSASSPATAHTVNKADTTTTITSDNPDPSTPGQSVTVQWTTTVNAPGAGTPTGTVTVTVSGGSETCNAPVATGQCSLVLNTTGSRTITASYGGDTNFNTSSDTESHQVCGSGVVTTTADSGAGSLRQIITDACDGTTITFDTAGAFATPQTITLTGGEIAISKNLTIKGPGLAANAVTISGNNASQVFDVSTGSALTVVGLTISGGQDAGFGGGIINNGTLTVANSTLTGNNSGSDGGAIANSASAVSLTLINTTISGNNANGSGGGVVVLGGTMTSINSTITNNKADNDANSTGTGGGIAASAGTTTLKNTIVAGNFNEDGASDAADDISGTVDPASSFNLIGTGGAGGLTNGVNNNQVGVASPGLGALGDNGGPTQTHALLSTSVAIEAGSNANLPADTLDLDGDANTAETLPVDQRGLAFPRVADSADANVIQTVDVGAYEAHPTIEDIANTSTNEDTVKNVSFNIGDDTGSLISTVTATSSNTTLVPNANLAITGSGGSRNLQITPAAGQSGTTTITVTVTATNGRTAVDTFDLSVGAVNDPPSGADNTVTTNEDTAYTFAAVDFGFTDPNDSPPNTLLAVKITTLPGAGTLTNNNVAVNAGDFIPVGDINGNLLKFTPAANENGSPYTSFTFQVQDNGGGTDLDPTPNTMTINVTAINDPPSFTIAADPPAVAQDSGAQTVLNFATNISAGPNEAGQVLTFNISPTGSTGTLTFSSGPAIDATTGTLTYTPNNGTSGTASFSVTLSDNGSNTPPNSNTSGAQSFTITVFPPNATPVVTATAANLAYLENAGAVAIDTGLTVTDSDSTDLTGATVAITTGFSSTQDTLAFSNQNGITGNYNSGSGVLTLSGTTTVANYQTALRSVTYANSSDNPTASRVITFNATDGFTIGSATRGIDITAVNDDPINTVPGPQTTGEDTPKVFSSGNGNQISVADVDLGANSIKITLTSTNGTMTLSTIAGLAFTTGDGSDDATMVFTGSLASVNTALNGMSFTPTPNFNGAASLQIVSDDQGNTGTGGPKTDTDTVNITVTASNDAPVVTATGGSLSYTENGAAAAIDTGLTVTDIDSTNLTGATVAITGNFANGQDVLAFVNQLGITGNYNAGTGVLTLTGTTTVANYQTALRSVTYNNSSDNPSTAPRTVTFTANDGTSTGFATRGITVTAVNDGPVNTVPGGQSVAQNTPLTFSTGTGNQISVADVDAGGNNIQVTLTAANGTLTLNGTSGLSFSFSDANGTGAGDGTADPTMTFRGTLANVNAALNGMTYTPTLGFTGATTVTVTSNDLGNTGTGGAISDTDVVNIQVGVTNVSISDSSLQEPKSGTANMIFSVTLSAPAAAGGASVSFTTQQQAPALNHATAGQDYTTTSGTLNFAAGEQFKTIQVPILSDNKNNEANETFLVVLSNPVNTTIADGSATGTILIAQTASSILISELRTSGPAGAGDDFVEIYNNTSSPITVNDPSSGGYGLFKMGADCNATPVLIGVIPNGTIIPARGHYLFVGSAYSLANYGGSGAAAGDQVMSQDLENDVNVAIFSTASVANISTGTRFDAVGFGANTGGSCDLLREGTTLTPLTGSVLEYSYFRDECGKSGAPDTFGPCPTAGFVQDTNVNSVDFLFGDTNGTMTPAGQRLSAPGPQNLGSPRQSLSIVTQLLDSSQGNPAPPNRVRDTMATGPNAAAGTLSVRRRFVNSTGAPVTQLRFRIVDFSSFPVTGATADLRAMSSSNITVTGIKDNATCAATGTPTTKPCSVTVFGTTLETPPNQPLGGSLNSSWGTGVVTLATPLAPGQSINLQFLLGVQKTGSFKFFFNIEALP